VHFVDTHCHLNFESYAVDRAQVIERAQSAAVTQIINPGVDRASSEESLQLAESLPGFYAAVGIHPNSTADFQPDDLNWIRALAAHEKALAIGEIGLDYHWDKSPKAQQFAAFEAQLALAAELNLPVIIHNREASEDVLAILENWAKTLTGPLKEAPGVLHSFSAPASIAERALAINLYLGFTGPITFKKSDDLRRIAAQIPLDRLLLETDGPFLTPEPHRGKRNEPAYIPLIADRIASLRQISLETLAQATSANAQRLFRIP
jgi:TatD DNase family protein